VFWIRIQLFRILIHAVAESGSNPVLDPDIDQDFVGQIKKRKFYQKNFFIKKAEVLSPTKGY
jgi:hypothetical protein